MKTLHPTHIHTPTEHITVHTVPPTESLSAPLEASTEAVMAAAPYIPGRDGAHRPAEADAYDEATGEMALRDTYGDVGRVAARSVLHEDDAPLSPLETEHRAANMPGKSKFAGSLGFLLRGKRAATRNGSPTEAEAAAPRRYSDDPNAPTEVRTDVPPDYDFSRDFDPDAHLSTEEREHRSNAEQVRREANSELLDPDEVKLRPLIEYPDAEAAAAAAREKAARLRDMPWLTGSRPVYHPAITVESQVTATRGTQPSHAGPEA